LAFHGQAWSLFHVPDAIGQVPFANINQAYHEMRGSVFGQMVQQASEKHLGFIKFSLTIVDDTLGLHSRHRQAYHLNRLMHDLRIGSRGKRRRKSA
jgi:hypothetical protein